MENNRKKITISPPEGALLARYTVRCKPLDVFKRQIYLKVLPLGLLSVVKGAIWYWILHGLQWGIAWGLRQLLDLHERIDDIVRILEERIGAFGWLFDLLFWVYVAYLAVNLVVRGILARTRAEAISKATLPEEYAFYETGLLYSNGMDMIRIPWKKVRLMTYSPLGMIVRAGSLCDTLLIPPRYFCTEFPALAQELKKGLGIKFWRLKRKHRDHAPMYDDPASQTVTREAPEGEVIGELTVKLNFSDLGYLYALWCRQIVHRHNRGVFGIICLFILAAALMVATFVMKEEMLLPASVTCLILMVLYAIGVWLAGMFRGRHVLVNRRDYRKPVRYVFYPDGFLMIYENGVSFVRYEDLEVIFEDQEGLCFFFSKRQCLFLPARYMRSRDGVRLSHYYKASLFNLDPTRGDRRIEYED